MKRLGLSLLVFPVLYSLAFADSVMPVLPGYETCSTASGSTICSFNKVTPTTPLPITGTINASIAGATSNASSGVAPTATNLPTVSYNYGFNGATWDQLQVDSLKNLKVVSVPGPGTTTTANSTIAIGNTFQNALSASATRKGCLLQNTSGEIMYIYFGTLGSATLTNTLQIVSGQSISCNTGGIVLTDAVGVTGPTAGNTYVVISQ